MTTRRRAFVKAIWVIFLFLFPWLTALVYLIARGQGMAERSREAAIAAKKDDRRLHPSRPPDVHRHRRSRDAKELLDAGTISQQEFDSLKAKALS